MPPKKVKRADNRYQTTLTIGRTPEGKPIKKYFYGETQKEANAKKKAYQDGLSHEKIAEEGTLADWIDKWTEASSSSENIRKSNKRYADKLKNALGDRRIDDIRMMDIKLFAQSMSKYSYSTVKQTRGIVNRIFEDAVRNRNIAVNPCSGVVWENAGKGTHRALEKWERELILQHHKAHRTGRWALLMLFGGLRRGEALALNWEDIDFKAKVIHVNKAIRFQNSKGVLSSTKTKAGIRDVPLLPQLKDALLEYDDRVGAVCLNASGEPISTQSAFERGWESWLNAMTNVLNGYPPIMSGRRSDIARKKPDWKEFSIRTHDLRHTFCTMLYNAGVGLKEAQYIMGHADSEMTLEVYTHLDEEKKLSAQTIMNMYQELFENQQDVKQDVKNIENP